jgi:hypothetical protein
VACLQQLFMAAVDGEHQHREIQAVEQARDVLQPGAASGMGKQGLIPAHAPAGPTAENNSLQCNFGSHYNSLMVNTSRVLVKTFGMNCLMFTLYH